jgi:hypothetical protein
MQRYRLIAVTNHYNDPDTRGIQGIHQFRRIELVPVDDIPGLVCAYSCMAPLKLPTLRGNRAVMKAGKASRSFRLRTSVDQSFPASGSPARGKPVIYARTGN